jgi:protein phosphatase PTC2/3
VIPGRLSVSRAIGDAHAKLKKLNGNPNVIISEPEIKHFKICASHDFIILGSDGLYDKMSNSDLINETWKTALTESAGNFFSPH